MGKSSGMLGKKHSEETREKIRNSQKEWLKNNKHPMLGKHHSEKTKRKIREKLSGENNPCYGRTSEKHPLWGKHHSEKTKEKMRLSHLGLFKGEKHPMWKGGIKRFRGYVFIWKPEHPNADVDGYVKRSRLVAENTLGRYLRVNEIPHHENEIRDDDSPENIKVMTRGGHQSFHNKNREKNRSRNTLGQYTRL